MEKVNPLEPDFCERCQAPGKLGLHAVTEKTLMGVEHVWICDDCYECAKYTEIIHAPAK